MRKYYYISTIIRRGYIATSPQLLEEKNCYISTIIRRENIATYPQLFIKMEKTKHKLTKANRYVPNDMKKLSCCPTCRLILDQ